MRKGGASCALGSGRAGANPGSVFWGNPCNRTFARIIHPHRRENRADQLRPWSHKACALTGSRRGEAACEAMGVALEQLARSGKDRSPQSEHRGELVIRLLSRGGRRDIDSGSRSRRADRAPGRCRAGEELAGRQGPHRPPCLVPFCRSEPFGSPSERSSHVGLPLRFNRWYLLGLRSCQQRGHVGA
jgi:hypothetical protein